MLAEHGIQLESIGGDVVGVPISALKVKTSFCEKKDIEFYKIDYQNTNIDKLLESIQTVAELQQLRGDPSGPVEGTILESKNEDETNEFNSNQSRG